MLKLEHVYYRALRFSFAIIIIQEACGWVRLALITVDKR